MDIAAFIIILSHFTEQKIWHFLLKSFGEIFWLIFKNFQLKFLDFGQKTADFTKF